jgi:UDP-glucose 4-epimerase
MANCLVIGGNGFLGSYLVDELVERGHHVTVFDRFSWPHVAWSSHGVDRITGDFMDATALRNAVTGQEHVFHFLSSTTPATADADPAIDLRTNVAQSVELFSAAADAGVSRVYFASTGGAMYGTQPLDRVSEEALPVPISPYAIGKQAIEGYLRYFQQTRGLDSVSFRISNPYGPRQRAGRSQGVIPIFLQRIAEGLPITVFGDGSMVRDYIFATDSVRMIAESIARPTVQSVYNVGSGVGTSVAELVDLAREITAMPVTVEYRDKAATAVDTVVLETQRYAADFGQQSFVSLRDGMQRTWDAINSEAP